jgi:hypothetical protein
MRRRSRLLRLKSTCHRGGIGRRAWFRSMYRQRCGGSSPFDGTKAVVRESWLAVSNPSRRHPFLSSHCNCIFFMECKPVGFSSKTLVHTNY